MTTKQILKALGATMLVSAAALAFSTESQALTATATLQVQANVQGNCTLTTTPVFFGTVADSVQSTTTGSVTVTCTNGTIYRLGLNDGGNSASCSGSSRCMKHATAANYLNYDLYSDAAMASRWGTTSGVDDVGATAGAAATTHTVYGRVPAQVLTGFAAGGYTDGITATVTF